MNSVALLVIAKEPLPGQTKTRLTPPCSPAEAAGLAGASLWDTLDVVARTPAARRVLVFEGDDRGWRPDGFELLAQRGRGLGERLASAFADVGTPALVVGMDTPQLTPGLLVDAMRALAEPDVDAVLAPTLDGGYWTVGFKAAAPRAFERVPMSSRSTCARQRQRLGELGLRVHEAPSLRDVDTIEDARAVAQAAPHTRFARALAALA
ncbi:MAG TPA: TIGR04282 family arsenosugar biosynthesis glycosyltransferase [Solirubrobacteraceae bacterium]